MRLKVNIQFYHLGHGLTVCDVNREQHGDYLCVAHINPDRQITWYTKEGLSKKDIAYIEHEAKTCNRTISISQTTKIFNTEYNG